MRAPYYIRLEMITVHYLGHQVDHRSIQFLFDLHQDAVLFDDRILTWYRIY